MAQIGNFRSAFHGFNRQDVANYIAYLNNKHTQELEQLRNQLRQAQDGGDLQERLAKAEERCAQLEARLAEPAPGGTEAELESYRRAERTERLARNRAKKVCEQASAVLDDAAKKAEEAVRQAEEITRQTSAQLDAYRESVLKTRDAYQEASAALCAIKPEED